MKSQWMHFYVELVTFNDISIGRRPMNCSKWLNNNNNNNNINNNNDDDDDDDDNW